MESHEDTSDISKQNSRSPSSSSSLQKNGDVSQNDGIVVIPNPKVDASQIKKVRLINLMEPFIVYGITLATIWGTMLDESNPWLYIILIPTVLWILFISPWWHYEKLNEKEIFLSEENRNLGYWYLECRGLGSPKRYYLKDKDGVRGFIKYKKEILKMMALWDILILCVPYAFQKDYKEVIVSLFGTSSVLHQVAGMIILLILANLVMFFVLFPIMMRLDNFNEGWKNELVFTVKMGIPLVIIMNLFFLFFWEVLLANLGTQGEFAMKGADPFIRLQTFSILEFGGQMAGYVAWGFLQQLLYLSVFSTNFSRAFDLNNDPKAVTKASLLSASFFGLIHLPNFWLSLLTWTAGFIWSKLFIKRRNLMILGISHGFLGTMGNKLLPISYNVGPNSV